MNRPEPQPASGTGLLLERADDLLAQRDLKRALQAYNWAERHGADQDGCAGGRWFAHMLAGNFTAAWLESDAIRARGKPDPHRFWQGEDIGGKHVIVRCLHGFGDAIQFLRFLPRLRAVASSVVVQVAPELMEICSSFSGADQVITWQDAAAPTPAYDVQIEVMELPYLVRATEADLPFRMSYLELPQQIRKSVAAEMGASSKPRVGLVWSAGEWNPSRSIPLADLIGVTDFEQIEFWNLQGGAARTDVRRHGWESRLRETEACNSGILPLAALISQLDAVVTVDTLAAHLAGALGVPALLMLQFAADWRWMADRSDSPWYPSVRIFRQHQQGDWLSVVGAVQSALPQLLLGDGLDRAA